MSGGALSAGRIAVSNPITVTLQSMKAPISRRSVAALTDGAEVNNGFKVRFYET